MFPAELISSLKMKGLCRIMLTVVITDYAVHNGWIHPGVDLYCVGNEESAIYLQTHQVPVTKICVSGIPVHPKFL